MNLLYVINSNSFDNIFTVCNTILLNKFRFLLLLCNAMNSERAQKKSVIKKDDKLDFVAKCK